MIENKKTRKCAIYARVSTTDQNIDNQIESLKTFASLQNSKVVETYKETASGGSANRPAFQQMLRDARLRKFKVIYIWSLDRFSREGIRSTLSYLKRLQDNGVYLKSLQESWLDTSDEGMGQLLIAIFSWMAEQERKRISERTKAGLARSKKKPGRPKGKKDDPKKPRQTAGYIMRWQKERVKQGGSNDR